MSSLAARSRSEWERLATPLRPEGRAFINGKTLTIVKKVGATLTKLGSVTFPATATVGYSLRFQVVGATLSAKVWATGTSEPSGWMVTARNGEAWGTPAGSVFRREGMKKPADGL